MEFSGKTFRQTKIKDNLRKRAEIVQAIRAFFISNDYLEVETPIRIPSPAPECHIDAVQSGDWFLHTSPELFMKRLLSAGYTNIFQITKCFRENERGRKHLPEMTMIEWYGTEKTYFDLMVECEGLIKYIAEKLGVGDTLKYQGKEINLGSPWKKISVRDAFRIYAGKNVDQALSEDTFDEIMGFEIEPHLGRETPTFLFDYPSEKAALAKRKEKDPSVAERFELYIAGVELCNAFSELTDSREQRSRFEIELSDREKQGKPVYKMPEKFLDALDHMPDAAGIALGIDRLVMLFTDAAQIDDVVSFVPEEL